MCLAADSLKGRLPSSGLDALMLKGCKWQSWFLLKTVEVTVVSLLFPPPYALQLFLFQLYEVTSQTVQQNITSCHLLLPMAGA